MDHLLFVRTPEQAAGLAAAWGGNRQVAVACPGERYAALGNGRFTLRPDEPQDYHELLAALPGLPQRVLYAWPWPAHPDQTDTMAAGLSLGIEGAFLLTQALLARRPDAPLTLLYVHAGAQAPALPLHEAFGAFARTVAHESLKLQWRHVGFVGRPAAALGDLQGPLAAEFAAAHGEVEVRYAGATRQRRTFREMPAPAEAPAGLGIRDGGLYLLSGGAGGLGYIVARHLASMHRVKLVLFGRRPADAAIQERIEELEFLGATCLYRSVDVADPAAVQGLVEEVHRTLGPIHGVFCGAGIHRDALIVNKSLADFRGVLRPKIMGALNLDLATREDPLDFVVYFSSIAALLGNAGQADYSYANSFLDHFASHRELLRQGGQRHGRSLSINWPLWQDGGMQVEAPVRQFAERTLGVPALTVESGLKLLGQAMRMNVPQVFAARGDRARIRKSFAVGSNVPTAAAAPFQAPAPQGGAAAAEAQVLGALQAGLLAGVVDILQVDPKDAQADTDLNRFGFDSLTFTTFGNRIAEELKIDLSPVVFFEYQTVRELSEHMFQEHREAVVAWYRNRHAAPATAVTPAPVAAAVSTPAARAVPAPVPVPAAIATAAPVKARPGSAEPIAIVGIDAVLPQSEDLEAFWAHLRAGADLVTEVPQDRWDWRQVWGDPFQQKNRTRVKWGGFVPDADKFDAAFFGISAREAALMDPQHRMFLQVVWRCIEDAGYRAGALAASQRVGIFCGSASVDYHDLLVHSDVDVDVFAITGNMFSVLVNRISHLFNFRGPSEPVETACSSSLVAMHRAMQAIRLGECDAAIAGGVHMMLGPSVHIGLDKGGFLSQKGRCATFDKDADGYARGEGCVAMMLKPLSHAEADGDVIHAVIRGSMVNHGGRVNTLTTPNPNAQAEVVTQAWRQAGVDPRTIGYIEAHGTGTALGDPIEVKALRRAFDQLYADWGITARAEAGRHCGLGSVKSNIGHLEFVAGASGVAKMVLAMRHQTLPASIHFNALNPYIQLEDSPFAIIDTTRPWPRAREADGQPAPLRAGVSSFGFGGVNCHVALEEYRPPPRPAIETAAPRRQVVLLSAKDEPALDRMAARLLSHLQQAQQPALGDVAYTLAVGREALPERLLLVADSVEELCQALAHPVPDDRGRVWRGSKAAGQERLAFLKSHDEARQYARSLLDGGDLPRLAQCWVDGLDIEWGGTPYATGRRIPLPTYPFAKTRHWVAGQTPAAPAEPADGEGFDEEVLTMLQDGLLTEAQARELLSI